MNQSLKQILNALSWVLVALVVLLAALLAGVRLIGLKPYAVLSGSMEPAYKVGSLVYVRKTDPEKLKLGDVITFMPSEDTIVTHRIVEVVPDEADPETLWFRTKGDGNEAADGSLVHYKNVIGRVKFSLPLMGYVSHFIQTPPGSYIALALVAFAFLASFVPELFSQKQGKHAAARKKKTAR